MLVLLAVAALAVLFCVVMVSQGRGGELTEFAPDVPPLDLPEPGQLTAVDFMALQLPVSLVGYHTPSVDETLQRAATAIGERDTHIAVLEQRVAELLAGRLQARQESYARPSWAPDPSEPATEQELAAGPFATAEHPPGVAGGEGTAAGAHQNLFDAITPAPGLVQVPGEDTDPPGTPGEPEDTDSAKEKPEDADSAKESDPSPELAPDGSKEPSGELPSEGSKEPSRELPSDAKEASSSGKAESASEEPASGTAFGEPKSPPGKHSASNGGGVATGGRTEAEEAR
ncbi:hypothetical protein AB0B89_09460 [Sphaerisporangium sp. NPDC049002]|uniref:hypothetical protein n=1 Tax=unclassified Sphaerisporangium TaxID=2630420 RepID=UPI0033E48325